MFILNKGTALTFSEKDIYNSCCYNFNWNSNQYYDNYMKNVSSEGFSILFIPISNLNSTKHNNYYFEENEVNLKIYYQYSYQTLSYLPQKGEKVIIFAKNDYKIYEFMGVYKFTSNEPICKYITLKRISTHYPLNLTFTFTLNKNNESKKINKNTSKGNKHFWSFEEDKFCCDIFRDNFIIQKNNVDINKIINQIAEKHPDLKKFSIRAKLQNIQQICYEFEIDNSSNIKPLLNYSTQSFNAMIQSLNEKNIKISKNN